ncbi:MAG: hypothetical protein E6R13_09110 [Spirochaetes bacterium]|nr:MAG: hypothetical protein E6R13_09110 [Spirochaetota bacterium]
MDALYDWLFHYNPHTKSWAAFRRENMTNYFNGDFKNVIKSKSQKTLEEIIIANDGDIKKIHKFLATLKQ